jgi:PPOX class probable F420-dependent enzyme
MAYHRMTADEVYGFLKASPARPGVLATAGADGRTHVAPIWYAVDDDDIVFNTGTDTVKGRHLGRAGRASLCVHDDRPPYAFASLEGPVTLSEEPAELRRWATVIGGRYMGAERAEEFGARNGVPGELLVRLRPERIVGAGDLAD